MEKNKPIISIRGAEAGYGERVILKELSFDVYPGEIFVILGSSGCGKSTLLKNMIGLYVFQKGQALVDGIDIVSAGEEDLFRFFQTIGVMYQGGALFGSLTILENVMLPLEEFTDLPQEAREAAARLKLKLVNLNGFENYSPSEISGGMQKRAAIARAMALDPKIIFLDEPSAGLDPITAAQIDQLIVELSRNLGLTFVVVSHELASIFTIADRVVFLDAKTKGIIAEGKPEDLREHSENAFVRDFFNRTVSAV